MNILITGGSGFIGSNLALALQEKYPEAKITVVDDFSLGHFKNLLGFKGDVIAADIYDFDWNSLGKVDLFFHQAAITDTTVIDQKKMYNINTDSFRRILHYCLKNDIKLVYASSAATYGNTPAPMIEGKNETPANVYGHSKLICDNIVRQIMKEHPDFPVVGLRYFNVYGPRESYKGKMASMIWQLYNQMKTGNNPRLFKYGEQKRDFVYVKDVIKANILAITGPSGIFNVGSGKAGTFNTIVKELNENMNLNKEIEYFDNPYDFYQEYTEADLTNAQRWGYIPDFDLEKGIKDYLEWIKLQK